MNNKKALIALAVILSVYAAMPVSLNAAENIPETPIDLILDMETELQLTDSQISALSRVNKDIIGKIDQLRKQVETGKKDICGFTSKWSADQVSLDNAAIVEYYKCLAELKSLELEAIVRTRTILTGDQLDILDNQFASTERIALKLDCIPQSCY